jgi:hypothetical protein
MKKRRFPAVPARQRAARQANRLIEIMFKEMGAALKDPARMDEPEWQRVFGNKQSLVVNLQKLVQALGALPEELCAEDPKPESNQREALTAEEMRLLTEWLAQGAVQR